MSTGPGPYTLCATDKAPVLHRGVPLEGDARCVGGVLEAAGELALKLPLEEHGRAWTSTDLEELSVQTVHVRDGP